METVGMTKGMKMNPIRTLLRGGAALLTSAALVLAGTGVASASESESSMAPAGAIVHSAAPAPEVAPSPDSTCPASGSEGITFEAVSAEAAEKLIARTHDLVDHAQVKVFSELSSLAFDRAIVYAHPVPEGIQHSVTIPIVNAVRISNFTVVYGADDRVSNYAETKIEKADEGFIKISQWKDGNQSLDKTVYVGELDLDASGTENAPSIPMPKSRDKAVACLAAVLGVSTGVATVVLMLCGGSCAVPEPTFSKGVCAACIGGIVTLGTASLSSVVKCIGYW